MGLTQKILLFVGLLIVALVATTLAYTTFQADRLARAATDEALVETRGVWATFQTDRYSKLKLGVRALANDPYFKPLVETLDEISVADTLRERGQDIQADFFIATDPDGFVIARSDRPDSQGEDLSDDPLVERPLEGEEAATVWRQGDRLFHAVSVPMLTLGDLKGVLIAGYAIDEALANNIRKLTHSEIAYLTPGADRALQLSVSSLGPKEPALQAALRRPELASLGSTDEPFALSLGGERHIGIGVPLESLAGETVGSVLALRSLDVEMAGFRQFRNSLVLVSLVVMAVALGLAYLIASRITGPVRLLAQSVERARDGSYSGAVAVHTSDEIGILGRAFNSLLADLREKEQMIDFLREGMTLLRRDADDVAAGDTRDFGSAATQKLGAVAAGASGVGPGSLFAGRYEIQGTVGKGGMGVVYRALDRQLDEVVALKVLRQEVLEQEPTLLSRFKQELKLARKITHRNVLRTHDFGEAENGSPYISMEYVEGVTLKELVASKGALPTGVGLRIAKQVCQGLEAAHAQGVVHRDIKPQNTLILPESGELKLMDFGIARVSEVKGEQGGLTSAGTVLGTPDYMAPEQAQGRPADFRSDIYSLGVVFFEIFCGRLPFAGDTVMATVLEHIQTPPPAPRQINPGVPGELEALILRCLRKEPSARYQGVSEILEDLATVSTHTDASAA